MRRAYPYREGEARAEHLLQFKRMAQAAYYSGIEPIPDRSTRFRRWPAHPGCAPPMSPEAEKVRLRVSAKVIARKNPKRLRPYVARQ